MKRDHYGKMTLEQTDLFDFTHAGVRFRRTSQLHERGAYTATVLRTAHVYYVTGAHSKRFPWAMYGDAEAARMNVYADGHYSTLVEAAEGIALHDRMLTISRRVDAR